MKREKVGAGFLPGMAPAVKRALDHAAGFPVFWERYPKKCAKKDASKAWDEIDWSKVTEEEILHSVEVHCRSEWRDPKTGVLKRHYVPYPATFIRGQRWTDELEAGPMDFAALWKDVKV